MPAQPAADPFGNSDLHELSPAAQRPTVRFAFHFPELIAAFDKADVTAGSARTRMRRLGIAGVLLVLMALLYTAGIGLLSTVDPHTRSQLSVAAAAIGLLGTGLGLLGVRKEGSRQQWLRSRVQTELLRLFHFHYIAAHANQIAAAATDAKLQEQYMDARRSRFEEFLTTSLGSPDQALAEATSSDEFSPFVSSVPPAPGSATQVDGADLFAAWSAQRFEWQLGYCTAKLEDHAFDRSPTKQEHFFTALSWACIALVVLLHVAHFAEQWLHPPAAWLETGVIWVALIALAGRAVEDGLRPQREVERYEQYRAQITAAMQRFTQATDEAQVEVMRSFEQVALEELRLFLRTHATARYLL